MLTNETYGQMKQRRTLWLTEIRNSFKYDYGKQTHYFNVERTNLYFGSRFDGKSYHIFVTYCFLASLTKFGFAQTNGTRNYPSKITLMGLFEK